jgi:AcrR family transcriptional regulator
MDEMAVDGRTARRDRNRLAVLDAVIELFAEDVLAPRPEEVAERSGVSLRSVYRYFSDPAELLRAAMARHLERVTPLLRIHDIGAGDLDDRIERFVEARLQLHEAIAPVARAARVASHRNELIREQYDRRTSVLRDQIDRHFAAELRALPPARRRAVASGIDTLCQLDGLDHLRLQLGLSRARTTEVLRELLTILLTA